MLYILFYTMFSFAENVGNINSTNSEQVNNEKSTNLSEQQLNNDCYGRYSKDEERISLRDQKFSSEREKDSCGK